MTDIADARAEMDCRTVENSFGQEIDTSIPAQLRFESEPEQDHERFHEALESRGYAPLSTFTDYYEIEGAFYDGEVLHKEHYNRIGIRLHGDSVRIFPKDHVPAHDELADLLCAIEAGFAADLTHDPLDGGGNDD